MAKRPDDFRGTDLTSPVNRIPTGRVALGENVRAYLSGGFRLRNSLSAPVITLDSSVQTIARLNDTTPAGPDSGFTLISGDTSGVIYNNETPVATGFTGNPVSLVPFRPNASVQPWEYIGDDAPAPQVTVAGGFLCNGMVKVRSDGLSRKMGIQEPPLEPPVSTSDSTTSGTDNLPATTYPWTNQAGKNPDFNFSHTSGSDGTAPVIIACPVFGATVTLTVTGTATVNGSTHSPGDSGPTGATTPGAYIPSPAIVVGAFTDASGNVVVAPAIGPVSIGGTATFKVPAGAVQLQVGIDSDSGTFNANSGSFTIAWTVATSAVATVISTVGTVTAYVWGDSPHSGPIANYIWKNPNDVGTGTPRAASTAPITATNNSWVFDSSPENGTVPVQWNTLNSDGSIAGSIPLFSPALESEGYQDFNVCIVGSIFVPAAGTYNFIFSYKDQTMLGIGGGATIAPDGVGNPIRTSQGQTITVVASLPILYCSLPNADSGQTTKNLAVTFPGAGVYQVEMDWDYWDKNGRGCILQCTSTSVNSPTIPPLPQGVRTNVSYAYKYRASETGAQSNPSPTTEPQLTPVLDNTVGSVWSPDPQVDKVDYYRQDEGLASYTYVATGPNDGLGGTIDGVIYNTPIVDELSDLEAANNQQMTFDDFEPVPSIDLPQSGRVNVSGGEITWVSGDKFNTRWLPGTTILIGSPTQLAYSFISRPTSTTAVTIPGVPDGLDLAYNIAEPILGAQPIAYLFGPTDNINYTFGVGDPNRPGTLYWCKGSNLDSWPDTNQFDVTDPSEALVNGAMSGGRGVLFSIKRAWVIMPNFFNALATVTGTEGSTWTLQDTSINRGLFIPRCLAVEGGGTIFFRVDDGIHVSAGGLASKSITDDDLYPLFVHEGSTPVPVIRNGVTIYPPNDSIPERQKFSIILGYLYWDYLDINSVPRTLVYDIAAGGWIWDSYEWPATARAQNEGESVQGTIVGCNDGTIRTFQSAGSGGVEELAGTVLTAAIGGQGWMSMYEITVEYLSNEAMTLTYIAADEGNDSYAPNETVLPSTSGDITKFTTKVSANKWKLLQFQFVTTDPTAQVFLRGSVAQCKPWGTNAAYKPVPLFGAAGGLGAQG